VIEVDQLTKRFGDRTAVDEISFSVETGEIVGFLGPNGAGKTTTLRMITGFLAPTGGRIRVGDVDALAHPLEARRRIGYMPEGVPLYPELRVSEYLHHRAELKGVPTAALKKRVDTSLEQAGITDVRDRIVGQLSKGYRQRVGLADALVADPPLLVLDEPTSGLDPNQIRQVRELVRGFAGQKTVLLSTHILPEVEATCGRVLIIHKGALVGEGAPSSLRNAEEAGQRVVIAVRVPEAKRVRSDDPAGRAVEVLSDVDGVTGVEPTGTIGGDVVRVDVRGEASPMLLERIATAIAAAGLGLRELRSEAARLEDVFTHLTTEERKIEADGEEEEEEVGDDGGDEDGEDEGSDDEGSDDEGTDDEGEQA
jgi:ABC-2 type transport system ATP-binding protein